MQRPSPPHRTGVLQIGRTTQAASLATCCVEPNGHGSPRVRSLSHTSGDGTPGSTNTTCDNADIDLTESTRSLVHAPSVMGHTTTWARMQDTQEDLYTVIPGLVETFARSTDHSQPRTFTRSTLDRLRPLHGQQTTVNLDLLRSPSTFHGQPPSDWLRPHWSTYLVTLDLTVTRTFHGQPWTSRSSRLP